MFSRRGRAGCLRVIRAQQQQRAALSTLRAPSPSLPLTVWRRRGERPHVIGAPSTLVSRKTFHSSSFVLAIQTVKVPNVAESITEGTLKQWTKRVGDLVAVDEEVATIETDKVDVSVNATHAGKIVELLADEEATVTVGDDLFRIEEGAEGESSSSPKPKEAPKEEPKEKKKEEAKEPEASVNTSVKEEQVATPSSSNAKPPPSPPPKDVKPATAPAAGAATAGRGTRNETRVKMNRMRLRIAERLKESQNAAAFLTTFNEIDMSSLKEFRSLYKDEVLKEHNTKLGYMSAFAKASALALQEIPSVNASIVDDTIVYHDYVDLSVAVATPKGLVTPVVRNVESMNFVEIEQAIAGLGKKARDGLLTLEDMAGGTFTISNGGVFGSLYGTPIINLPQSAVLGMHAITDRAHVVNGKIEIRPIMVVALTYDHRLLDGREAVTFLVRVKQYVEDPRKMLLKS